MRKLVLTLALSSCAGSPSYAQIVSPLNSSDLSAYMTKAQATSDIANIVAQIPQPANAAPVSEVVGGGVGSTTTRYALQDHTHPRITRAAVVTTDASGGWSVTWSTALSAIPVVLPIPVNTTAQPVVCNVSTRTTTTASGKCWLSRTLPATISLLSALVSYDIFGTLASGISVQVLAIPTTQ